MEVVDAKDIPSISHPFKYEYKQAPHTLEAVPESAQETVLDPNGWVRIAQYGSSISGCEIKFRGEWVPGGGHPAWGPSGSGNHSINGCRAWCVVLQVWAGNDVVQTFCWPVDDNGAVRIGYFGFPTSIVAFMNDDQYGDNTHAGEPMTAMVNFF